MGTSRRVLSLLGLLIAGLAASGCSHKSSCRLSCHCPRRQGNVDNSLPDIELDAPHEGQELATCRVACRGEPETWKRNCPDEKH